MGIDGRGVVFHAALAGAQQLQVAQVAPRRVEVAEGDEELPLVLQGGTVPRVVGQRLPVPVGRLVMPPQLAQAVAEQVVDLGMLDGAAEREQLGRRVREATHQPLEVKQQITNFINEELRHHEASFRIAEALDQFHASPRSSYMEEIIPSFHDENHERKLPFLAGLALNALFESMSGDLLAPRTRNAKFESIRQICKLIDRDEARHVQFGRILLRYHAKDISAEDKQVIGQVFVTKLRQTLLRGVYSVVNLPEADREKAGQVRALSSQWGLGASHPDEEVEILRGSLKRIREWVEPHGFVIPEVPELDGLPDPRAEPALA